MYIDNSEIHQIYNSLELDENELQVKIHDQSKTAADRVMEMVARMKIKSGEMHKLEIVEGGHTYTFFATEHNKKEKIYYLKEKIGRGHFGEVVGLVRLGKESNKILKFHRTLSQILTNKNAKSNDKLPGALAKLQKKIEDAQKEVAEIESMLQKMEAVDPAILAKRKKALKVIKKAKEQTDNLIAANKSAYNLYKIVVTDLKNEVRLLQMLHKKEKRLWGIEDAPSFLTKILAQSTGKLRGYLGKRYDENYDSFIKKVREKNKVLDAPSLNSRLYEIHQLLGGLEYLHKNNFLHGDLKPDNFLVRQKPYLAVHIADFGKARCVDDMKAGVENSDTLKIDEPFCNFATHPDYEKALAYKKAGQKDLFVAQEKKRDVFALGCSLYCTFQGKLPYQSVTEKGKSTHAEKGWRDTTLGVEQNFREDIPQKLKEIIQGMVQPDPEKRSTAEQAFQALQSYMQSDHEALFNQIVELRKNST